MEIIDDRIKTLEKQLDDEMKSLNTQQGLLDRVQNSISRISTNVISFRGGIAELKKIKELVEAVDKKEDDIKQDI